MSRRILPDINYESIISRMFQNQVPASHIAKLLNVSRSFVYTKLRSTGTPTRKRVGVPRED